MTRQPPTEPPARPPLNQAPRRYGGSHHRHRTPEPSAVPGAPPAPDRRAVLIRRVRSAAVTLLLMIATGVAVAVFCLHHRAG